MGQILHARATTTPRIREEIQNSSQSIIKLAKLYNLNPKTVDKWKKRKYSNDLPTKPSKLETVLSSKDEQIICAFRKSTQLPLDDCFISLKDEIKHLTRSNLHRCLKRHNMSVLPKIDEKTTPKKKFKNYEIGFVHIDITELLVGKEKSYLFVAIDRVTKFIFVKLYDRQTMENSVDFLQKTIDNFPYLLHKILTDNGKQFTYGKLKRNNPLENKHPFTALCNKNGTAHRTTKPYHPWTNGQVERFNRTIKDATVKIYCYDTVKQLENHLNEFVMAYNFAKKLKSLKFLTPMEKIITSWKEQPKKFKINPYHYVLGLNN